jgi:hypothetical protein
MGISSIHLKHNLKNYTIKFTIKHLTRIQTRSAFEDYKEIEPKYHFKAIEVGYCSACCIAGIFHRRQLSRATDDDFGIWGESWVGSREYFMDVFVGRPGPKHFSLILGIY